MANPLFSTVAMPRIGSNVFDMSRKTKTSFKLGMLVPYITYDCIPGDKWTLSVANLVRFQALLAPLMHRCDVTTHFFFVPYRILWNGFEDFISPPTYDFTPLVAPYIDLSDTQYFNTGTIAEYMGIPAIQMVTGQSKRITPFYFAAYRMIYDEYYRDQDLQPDDAFVPLVPGDNDANYGTASDINGAPYVRSFEHDYFTSCRPFAQKGEPVMLPLTFQNNIPVELAIPAAPGALHIVDSGDGTDYGTMESVAGVLNVVGSGAINKQHNIDFQGTQVVDVQSNAVTLDTLRTAIVVQEFLEKDARSGTRYTEKIQAHFGVKSSDSRLQRPEYIGGFKQVMSISEVVATAQTGDNSDIQNPVGQMAGHAISASASNRFSFFCEEFGCIIGIVSVLPEPAYFQGLHRMFTKFEPLNDFCWPDFANLGEQEVGITELFFNAADVNTVFGYQSRYAEYKSMPDMITGQFRDGLDYWHMAVQFDTEPSLSSDFILAMPEKFDRVFAVDAALVDSVLADLHVSAFVSRKLPRYGIPHFGSVTNGY